MRTACWKRLECSLPTRPTRGAPHTAGRAPSNLAEPLSERELEVLQLIALGLSNREIGDRLFRALDTIKGTPARCTASFVSGAAPKRWPVRASSACSTTSPAQPGPSGRRPRKGVLHGT
ncbi:MAG: LuxR C-terminal-related transcriptional regulator [Gammaproteobacteria bacterium]|nr:LuxR C-terminal-related transcriptional regulator [Gammaproteobacteria bacterium]